MSRSDKPRLSRHDLDITPRKRLGHGRYKADPAAESEQSRLVSKRVRVLELRPQSENPGSEADRCASHVRQGVVPVGRDQHAMQRKRQHPREDRNLQADPEVKGGPGPNEGKCVAGIGRCEGRRREGKSRENILCTEETGPHSYENNRRR